MLLKNIHTSDKRQYDEILNDDSCYDETNLPIMFSKLCVGLSVSSGVFSGSFSFDGVTGSWYDGWRRITMIPKINNLIIVTFKSLLFHSISQVTLIYVQFKIMFFVVINESRSIYHKQESWTVFYNDKTGNEIFLRQLRGFSEGHLTDFAQYSYFKGVWDLFVYVYKSKFQTL